MRTQVFAHKGFVGIQSDLDAEGLINNPRQLGQLGMVLDAKYVDISREALDLLKKIPTSSDDIGDVMCYDAGEKVIFAFLGGPIAAMNCESEGDNEYNPNLLEGVVTIVENNPPAPFVSVVEKIINSGANLAIV